MGPGTGHEYIPQRVPLPHQLTSFIGREVEVAELKRLLRERRLVTLTGAGGSGKTRLAIEAAATLERDFPGGIFLVELAPLSAPEFVVEAVARALGVELSPERPPMEALADFLRDREALLVLDNCEHLLDECARLAAALLAVCAGLRVLATSREPLGVQGECIFRVPLLSVPDPAEAVDPSRLGDFEAVQLFVDRARLASREFSLTEKSAQAVAQVCIRLDGIPLALELAAASLRGLTVTQLAEHLDRRFGLLTGGDRTALPRHRTLQALLDWSYNLLDPHQQTALRRLAIFPGDWTLEAAEAVCAGGSIVAPEEVLPLLMQLVNKSLVQLDQATGRYRMLETIRLYALGKLQTSGEEESLAHLYFAYFCHFAEQAAAHLGGPDQQEWFVRLESEQANLRAALSWAIAAARAEEGAQMALALWKFWVARAYHHEGQRWLEQILALEAVSPHSPQSLEARLPSPLRARLLGNLGVLAHTMNDFEQASRYHEEALQIWREQGDKAGIAAALFDLGWQHYQAMDLQGARRYAKESLEIARQTGDRAAVASALNLVGIASVDGERLDEVVPLIEESLTIWRELGVLAEVASGLINLARAEQRLGHLERAGQLALEALRLNITMGDYNNLIGPLVILFYFEFGAGDDLPGFGQQFGYLAGSKLAHGPATAARLIGVMAAWEDKVVGRHSVQWVAFVAPLCEKLGAEMGEAHFEREVRAGRTLSSEEIVQLAELVVTSPAPSHQEQGSIAAGPSPSLPPSPLAAPPEQVQMASLTRREMEVLRLVVAGLTNAQAAERLSVTPRTVNAHLTSIYAKTGVTSRAGAVRFAMEHGIL